MGGAPAFRPLPIVADEGFPQAFRLALDERIYEVALYVNVSERRLDELAPDALLALPEEEAHLVVAIARATVDAAAPAPVFKRKVVPGLVYDAGELALRFDAMTVARRNLNAPGVHGSDVRGVVAATWAS